MRLALFCGTALLPRCPWRFLLLLLMVAVRPQPTALSTYFQGNRSWGRRCRLDPSLSRSDLVALSPERRVRYRRGWTTIPGDTQEAGGFGNGIIILLSGG